MVTLPNEGDKRRIFGIQDVFLDLVAKSGKKRTPKRLPFRAVSKEEENTEIDPFLFGLRFFGQQHRDQSGKTLFEFFLAQRIEMLFALNPRADQARFAQNLDMVRQSRLREVFDFEAGAIFLARAGQTLGDLHANRIAERGAYGSQRHL